MDPAFAAYLDTVDGNKFWEKEIERLDMQHPTDPTRSYLKDLRQKVEDYDKLKVRAGLEDDEYYTRDLHKIRIDLKKEYANPLALDKKPQFPLHAAAREEDEARRQEMKEQLEAIVPETREEIEARGRLTEKADLMAFFERYPDYAKKTYGADFDLAADKMLGPDPTAEKAPAKEAEDDAIEPEFEEGAMFSP